MKKFKKSIAITVVLSLCMLLAAPVDAKAKVKLNLTKATLSVGGSVNLKLLNNKKKVKWSSSNKKVATVTNKGKVKAKKKGNAKIIAKVGKKKYTCKVTVGKVSKVAQSTKKPSATTNPSPTPTEIRFNLVPSRKSPYINVYSKDYLGINCIFLDIESGKVAKGKITWQSTDETVATCQISGWNSCIIVPHKSGECDIIVTVVNITKSYHIIVKD